ncbi:MAG: hypothetical protein ACI84K_002146 [Pseudohongiellaceae bacterium]|jgi:hypothetical protein
MSQKLLYSFCLMVFLSAGSNLVMAGEYSRAQWVDISNDKNLFDKKCDYKVWVLEENKWRETWYLEAFDSENAFYTINRQSSTWSDKDYFYALNYKDKTKFLIGENSIDVVPFALCLSVK